MMDEIDHLVGPDAMRWAPDRDEAMPALLLGMDQAYLIQISQRDPMAAITARVGDPVATRLWQTSRLGFWVGDNSQSSSGRNDWATAVFHALLRAIAAGDYAVSDRERDRVRRLLATPSHQPVLHGPCLITGMTGDQPTALPDGFLRWLRHSLNEAAAQVILERLVDHPDGPGGGGVIGIVVIYH